MPDASYSQVSFLGGQWSKASQGRGDQESYRTGMNLCFNGLPVEEGAWTRRPGTLQYCTTRNGQPAVLRAFDFQQAQPYLMEFSSGFLRFHEGQVIASQDAVAVASVNNGTSTVTTASLHGWSPGQQVVFSIVTQVGLFGPIAPLIGKQWVITLTPATNQITLADAVTGEPFSGVTLGTNILNVSLITEFVTPYTTDLQAIRVVQNDTNVMVLDGMNPVQIVQSTSPPSDGFANFTLGPATFIDGPYLDPPTDGSLLTPTGTEGSIVLVASGISQVNGGQGFLVSDVGRLIRLFSEPADWDSGTTYAAGTSVTYNGSYFVAQSSTTGQEPDTNPLVWAITPTGAAWTWGTITNVASTASITVELAAGGVDIAGTNLAGGPLLYELPISVWRLGKYGNTNGYPSCGTYHEGRFWLAGGGPNSFDSSVSNPIPPTGIPVGGGISFAPTDLYGTVADNNGISETLNLPQINAIFWISPYLSALVMGTQGGEIVLQASSLNDPLTPTSIQAHEVTHFGSENIEPRRTGMSTVFVRRFGRKLTEYISDVYSQKFSGTNLSIKAADLMAPGIAEIAYQMETTPIVWARMNDGSLNSLTYRRDSPFGTQPASFAGWAPHALGSGRSVLSIQAGPSVGGNLDNLSLVTQDPATGYCYIEGMTAIFLETDDITNAWFVDGGANPSGADIVTIGSEEFVKFYGLDYVAGQTLSVWGAGQDLGDFIVQSDGTILVPINQPGSLFTTSYLASLTVDPKYPTLIQGGTQPSVFTMDASENFPPSWVPGFATGVNYNADFWSNQFWAGIGYDAVNRQVLYTLSQFEDHVGGATPSNTTGFTTWDGFNSTAPGANYHAPYQGLWVLAKNIDTGLVTQYDTFTQSAAIPNGQQGSDGTWRYRMLFSGSQMNIMRVVDPRTGNLWMGQTALGSVMCLRRAEGFAQNITPLIIPQATDYFYADPIAVRQNWTYVAAKGFLVADNSAAATILHLTPRDFDDYELGVAQITSYIHYTFPSTADPNLGNFVRSCAGLNALYFLAANRTGTRVWVLKKFTDPTGTVHGSVSGGGFSDITPWTSTTGPNVGSTAYTHDNQDPAGSDGTSKAILMYLPGVNQLVAITKNLACDVSSTPSTDPAETAFDCTYVKITGAVSQTWAGFVSGYMNSLWRSSTKSNASYAVMDCYETNIYLNNNDYVFPGVDYTRRWFAFIVQPVSGGSFTYNTANNKIVMVQYQFVYGAPPVVVQIVDEAATPGWDQLPNAISWQTANPPGTPAAVARALAPISQGGATPISQAAVQYFADNGIADPVTGAFWWSGSGDAFGSFSPLLLNRANAEGENNEDYTGPPFLRLSFASPATYTASFSLGYAYTSRGQLLRPFAPNEAGAANGPAQGKTRRTHQMAALLSNVQGISFGTDFTKILYPANLTAYLNGPPIPITTLYSGIFWDSLEDDYTFDSMPCWEITRPYPATVVSFEAFLHSQDR